jgi:predicted MFS family arabinose efflux permease
LAVSGFAAVAWRQVFASAMMLGVMGILVTGYGIFAVPLAQEFKPSRMLLMLAITVMSIVTAIISPFLGNLVDRVPLKRLMLLGMLSATAALVALSFTTSIYQVLIVYGLLVAPVNVLMGPIVVTVLLSRWFVDRRGRAIGMAMAGMSVVSICLPPLIQWLLDNYDWRVGLRLLALTLGVFSALAVAMVVDDPAKRGMHPDGSSVPSERARAERNAVPISVKSILADPSFWMIGAIFGLCIAGMKGLLTNLMPLAIDEGIKPSSAALLMSIFSAASLCSKLIFAAIADRVSPRLLLVVTIAGFVAGLLCLTRAESGFWVIAVGVSLVAVFAGLSSPVQSMLVPRIFGQRVIGRVSGLLSLVMLALSLNSPPAFGLIYDRTGSYDAMFFILAVIAGATMLFVPYIRLQPKGVEKLREEVRSRGEGEQPSAA